MSANRSLLERALLDWQDQQARNAAEEARNARHAAKLRRCGARRKRDGQPCEVMALENGRCKFHGGYSTGPKTVEGRRALANLRQNQARLSTC
jgi:hypothetical protein